MKHRLAKAPQVAARVSAKEWRRLGGHALALALVALAVTVSNAAGVTDAAGVFCAALAAVAAAAAFGGVSAAAVASLSAILVARLTSDAALNVLLLFAGSSGVIAILTARLASVAQSRGERLAAAEIVIHDLNAAQKEARVLDFAARRLEHVVGEYALVVLNGNGRIAHWRAGAARLYGRTASDAIGQGGGTLFGPDLRDSQFHQLLADARQRGLAHVRGSHVRADGTMFDADVQVEMVRDGDDQAFVLLVRDRTPEEERQTIAASAADAERTLRAQVDVAQRQLAMLQALTDPVLNSVAPATMLVALLDRLRESIGADGAAFVRLEPGRRRMIVHASDGLSPRSAADRHKGDASAWSERRILFIQNDARRVAETTLIGWPDTVSSLVAVPVLSAGRIVGGIEVAHARPRRSTEWEMALIQVVAARAAGLALDQPYADAVA